MIGVDPGPLTLRELVWMARGRDIAGWNHTAAVLATIVNAAPFRGKRKPVRPADCHPYVKPQKRRVSLDIGDFKAWLPEGHRARRHDKPAEKSRSPLSEA